MSHAMLRWAIDRKSGFPLTDLVLIRMAANSGGGERIFLRSEVADIVGISAGQAELHLQGLVNDGVVRRVGDCYQIIGGE